MKVGIKLSKVNYLNKRIYHNGHELFEVDFEDFQNMIAMGNFKLESIISNYVNLKVSHNPSKELISYISLNGNDTLIQETIKEFNSYFSEWIKHIETEKEN